MKIYLFLNERMISFTLPNEVVGSFGFDEQMDSDVKLINIEARDDNWVIYSTEDVSLIQNNVVVPSLNLLDDSFYVLRRQDKNYLIYVSDLSLNKVFTYSYDKDVNLIIGNTNNASIQYPCTIANDIEVYVHYVEDRLVIERKDNSLVYVNNKALVSNQSYLNVGDQVNIYGFKIIILSNLLVFNNPGNKIVVLSTAKINNYKLEVDNDVSNIVIKDRALYDKKDYFSKSPRIRRTVDKKVIKLSPPPQLENNHELPMILTVGPMLTMGVTSGVMVMNVLMKINTGETTFGDSWSSLLTSGTMLVSMLLWPTLTRMYNKKMKTKRRENIIFKYSKYLEQKRLELNNEVKLQKEILMENLISVKDCLSIVANRNMHFWNKRIDESDFLVARVGNGNDYLRVDIEYPEGGFTIEEDDLKVQADKLIEEFKYVIDVPIGYSFKDNIVTAVMGVNKLKSYNFINNIILQLITFYSYEDLKIVCFTNDGNLGNFDYLKYLNHSFSNNKEVRFFASDVHSINNLCDYLYNVILNRSNDSKGDKVPLYKPHYFIIVDDYELIKNYDFIKFLTESDVYLGFNIVILESRMSKLPSRCNNYINLQNGKSGILKNRYDRQEQVVFNDEIVENIDMMQVTEVISNVPIEFEEGIKALPDSVTFMEMERVGKVEQLNILNRWNTNDATTSLRAEIGVNNQNEYIYLDLHEKYHGPHGLIAGTTGSGKSEFIITYILSMCINYSPDDVAFILIDYKGGGLALAFENRTTGVILPHLAGTITNLDKAEMDRTLVSIDSEIKRRQHMFNLARDQLGESTIDIYKYQRHYKDGRLKEAIPHLFIICDEFAELKAQQPEFMDNLISVARIGRSLGVHLILATQKPTGVVNDQIWSNTKFRVCLKVQDEADSKEMLKRPEAAHITQAGRFYLQVGYDEIFVLGQSGWCGAKYYPSDKIVKHIDKDINFINDFGKVIKSVREENEIKIEAQGEQLAAIMKNIITTANSVGKKARRLWLDNISSIILVDNLYKKYNIGVSPYNVDVVLGEYDAPERQEQGVVRYNYINDGNTIVYSRDSSEAEMFLNTLIYSTTRYHMSEEVNFYIIDYGSEALRRYAKLPQVGGMVFEGENEKLINLLKMIDEEVNHRKKLFVNYGGSYSNYIASSDKKLPLKVIVINNYDSFIEANQNMYDVIPEIVRDSVRYGIVFIFTCSSTNSISRKVSQNFENAYAFKLKESSDYMFIFNSKNSIYPRAIDGRGILNNNGVHEFQTASITNTEEELNKYLPKFIEYENSLNKTRAVKIPVLPYIVRYEDVSDGISNLNSVPVGIVKNNLSLCNLDMISNVSTIISSNKLDNIEKFGNSLMYVLKNIPNNKLIIIDPLKKLNNSYASNYYVDKLDSVIDSLSDYFNKLISSNSNEEGIIVVYGLSNFSEQVEDGKKILEFVKLVKKYKKFGVVAFDEVKKLKGVQIEDWYMEMFKGSDGVWIGRGAGEQNILKTDNYSRELQENYPNDMGFYIASGEAILVKLIDFVTKDEEVDDE